MKRIHKDFKIFVLLSLISLTLTEYRILKNQGWNHNGFNSAASNITGRGKRRRGDQKCGEKLARTCGKEIRNGMLDVEPVSDLCCVELVNMGWICHTAMMRLAIATMDDKDVAAKIILNKDRVYYRCAGIVNNIAPAPSTN